MSTANDNKPTDSAQAPKKPKKGGGIIGSTLRGSWLSTNFFGRHWGVILALVVIVMVYITNRYQCVTAMETIQSLEKELQVVKSERIRERSYYMSDIRESAMQRRVDSLGLKLEIRMQPPYKLTVGDENREPSPEELI